MDEKQMGSQTAREGGSSCNVQDWNMMECRMAYLQAQMEEAQAALARKTTQQEAIEKRAEDAEAAQAKAEAEVRAPPALSRPNEGVPPPARARHAAVAP